MPTMYKIVEVSRVCIHLAEGFRYERLAVKPRGTRLLPVPTGAFHLVVGKLGVTVRFAKLRSEDQAQYFYGALLQAWEIYEAVARGEEPDLIPRYV